MHIPYGYWRLHAAVGLKLCDSHGCSLKKRNDRVLVLLLRNIVRLRDCFYFINARAECCSQATGLELCHRGRMTEASTVAAVVGAMATLQLFHAL